ncbi:zinc ABC transporter ATP-binding protein AztA [Zavarzinia compransoris]|uniref:ABC transporter n=1 Tax=Zavarzinia compransoris TaxID=1264899 RepID=A0A317E956_9PROT|nr:zinc ABC transporter ATP-binding protein AztA [Zavarzinia compransoris]PWR23261.1 ABC transporter [Zavarzinia compransoris]TDP46173.1 zinc/manganese transport system ATP-binding protein [Zavarzinia compransoris]
MSRHDAILVEDLTVAYDRHPAVHHVSCRLAPGSMTAVVGPNGAGKSTLIKAIVGLLKPAEGRVSTGGLRRADIAYLPQQAEIDRSFPITVADTVALGHWCRAGILGRLTGAMRRGIAEALSAVGLEGFERRPIGSLSVGQFQRVLFARLLLQDASVILLDEPFNAIDARTTADLLDLVARWHGEKRTVVAVLHDMEQVRHHFPDTLLLARELIACGPTPECLTAEHLLTARRMSEGWNEDAAVCEPVRRRA